MSKLKRLVDNYEIYIGIPWRDAAAAQRVIFCVYNPVDELKLRAKIDEFELATGKKDHSWLHFDLTDTFAEWLSSQKYAKSYFQKPQLLSAVVSRYGDYLEEKCRVFLKEAAVDENTVVAVSGVASLFGFIKVKEMVDRIAPLTPGRLLVFFPGSYENNNFRLLDGYDGWNYHAYVITPDKDL